MMTKDDLQFGTMFGGFQRLTSSGRVLYDVNGYTLNVKPEAVAFIVGEIHLDDPVVVDVFINQVRGNLVLYDHELTYLHVIGRGKT